MSKIHLRLTRSVHNPDARYACPAGSGTWKSRFISSTLNIKDVTCKRCLKHATQKGQTIHSNQQPAQNNMNPIELSIISRNGNTIVARAETRNVAGELTIETYEGGEGVFDPTSNAVGDSIFMDLRATLFPTRQP